MLAIKEIKPLTTTWLVTFWQGGTITVEARNELEAVVAAARSAPWADVKRIEAWD
jgi:hypothetical protein